MRLPVFCGAEGWGHVEFITGGMVGLTKYCCVGLDHVKSLWLGGERNGERRSHSDSDCIEVNCYLDLSVYLEVCYS